MFFQNTISLSFKQWLLQENENRILLLLSFVAILITFTWLKVLFPYPNFMPPDSFSYIEAAYYNQFINIWAIGYSKFLRLVSCFSNSHFILILIQYLLLQFSVLYFLFTFRYLFTPGIWLFRILIIYFSLNPLHAHIANYVSSDSLFVSLSIIWFTQILWILRHATLRLVLQHALILTLAFMVRHNAIYYPLISIIILLVIKHEKRIRLVGISAIVVLLSLFFYKTRDEYLKTTGADQYSAFGGWQIAANALYGYANSKLDDPITVPSRFKQLHTLVNHHMDSIKRVLIRPDNDVAIYYLWNFKSPLRIYMKTQEDQTYKKPFFNTWSSLGPLYAKYGSYLIRKHPMPFIKYYLWPNLIKFYVPPPGFLEYYNLGRNYVDTIAVSWFGWKDNRVSNYIGFKSIKMVMVLPVVFSIINILYLLTYLSFALLGYINKCSAHSKMCLKILFLFWIVNLLFSVWAAPIELRYQLFPITITLAFLCLIISQFIKEIWPNKILNKCITF